MTEAQSREPIVTEWGGLPNYECPVVSENGKRCEFATLEPGLITTHLDPKWGPHKVLPAETITPVLDPLANDERAELEALREKAADLQRELTTTKGKLTKAQNQLDKVAPSGDGDNDAADDADANEGV